MIAIKRFFKLTLLVCMAVALTSCDPNVYASVGYSSWGGHNGGLGGSISLGGRICC